MGVRNSEIRSLKNLGPRCEEDLNAVGIFNREDLERVGVEQAYRMIFLKRLASGQSIRTMNAMYLYAMHGAIHGISCLALEQSTKDRYRRFAAELRAKR